MKTYLNPVANKYLKCIVAIFIFSFFTSKGYSQTHPWVTPKFAVNIPDPVPSGKIVESEAKVLYATNCSPCHGGKGKGDGPAAQALSPKPADHTSPTVQNETDGSLFWKLSTGRSPMPGFKASLTDKQRWELVDYIRALGKKH